MVMATFVMQGHYGDLVIRTHGSCQLAMQPDPREEQPTSLSILGVRNKRWQVWQGLRPANAVH
jgi:hypothetical protein